MQKVHLGITQSGQHGLFTGQCLAWSLTPEQYQDFKANPDHAREHCKQGPGFEFVVTQHYDVAFHKAND